MIIQCPPCRCFLSSSTIPFVWHREMILLPWGIFCVNWMQLGVIISHVNKSLATGLHLAIFFVFTIQRRSLYNNIHSVGYTLQSYWVTGIRYSFNSLQGSLDSEPTQRRVERSLWEKDKLLHPWPLPQMVACPCRYFLSTWTYIRTWWHYEYETLPYSVKRL